MLSRFQVHIRSRALSGAAALRDGTRAFEDVALSSHRTLGQAAARATTIARSLTSAGRRSALVVVVDRSSDTGRVVVWTADSVEALR